LTRNVLLLGNTGQLGWELNRTLLTLGDITAVDYPHIDLANPDSIRKIVRKVKPNLIVNATAFTNVDKAESESELALAINGTGPGILAEEAKRLHAALIHYSTDYVFDGNKGTTYREEDEPNPINVYGETKLAGESAVQAVGGAYMIFRTSWVYSLRRPSFVTKVISWANEHETLRIVDDQISTPTSARTLAEVTTHILFQAKTGLIDHIKSNSGLFHLANDGYCSRYDWAKFIIDNLQDKTNLKVRYLERAKSSDFSSPAIRPLFSVLELDKIKTQFHLNIPNWDVSLKLSLNK